VRIDNACVKGNARDILEAPLTAPDLQTRGAQNAGSVGFLDQRLRLVYVGLTHVRLPRRRLVSSWIDGDCKRRKCWSFEASFAGLNRAMHLPTYLHTPLSKQPKKQIRPLPVLPRTLRQPLPRRFVYIPSLTELRRYTLQWTAVLRRREHV
jgi:hypothetical protein